MDISGYTTSPHESDCSAIQSTTKSDDITNNSGVDVAIMDDNGTLPSLEQQDFCVKEVECTGNDPPGSGGAKNGSYLSKVGTLEPGGLHTIKSSSKMVTTLSIPLNHVSGQVNNTLQASDMDLVKKRTESEASAETSPSSSPRSSTDPVSSTSSYTSLDSLDDLPARKTTPDTPNDVKSESSHVEDTQHKMDKGKTIETLPQSTNQELHSPQKVEPVSVIPWVKDPERPPQRLPIRFVDCIGRNYIWPWKRVKSWQVSQLFFFTILEGRKG